MLYDNNFQHQDKDIAHDTDSVEISSATSGVITAAMFVKVVITYGKLFRVGMSPVVVAETVGMNIG